MKFSAVLLLGALLGSAALALVFRSQAATKQGLGVPAGGVAASRELPPLQLVAQIPVPEVSGRIDHFTVNPKALEEADITLTVALASMRASMHVFRLLANNGLVSPKDIDESSTEVIHDLERLPQRTHGAIQEFVVKTFAELKAIAATNWKGE